MALPRPEAGAPRPVADVPAPVADVPAPVADVEAFLDGHGEELIAFRRNLHAHPELSWAEHQTTSMLASRLHVAGLRPEALSTGTGLVCDIVIGDGAGPTVALRADIDALPIDDDKDVPYRSEVAGVCHACGHDVHATVVLGAGLALSRLVDQAPPGKVRLIFQPAEEQVPGGARALADLGVMEGVDVIFALHCDPSLPVGQLGVRTGPVTSAADRLEIVLQGRGGHTARPHLTTDLVHVASRVVSDLPAGLARLTDSRGGANLTFGAIHAGHAHNVIPTSALIKGTMRATGRATWERAPALLERLLDGIVSPFGASYHLDYQRGSPPVENDRRATEVLAGAAGRALGRAAVVATEQSAGGEDFSWFLEHAPGSYGRLGARPPDEVQALDLHASTFDVDERSIGIGVRVLVQAAVDSLRAYRR